ncbi:amino acid adenylation domain-containing protein [Streptomyces sp. BE20]|uniref:non-ribosomal peptide synthetase n=1 Tax=Streptomyces sp. BE20 TaxID=3002525 RepID=UPI002E7A0E64|nr:amino acid adenylation domain-containing protein [Streptomyces sp. BE20]MEE1822052.1 amino acid adenylation domain-containing protein [Streptomyces sp. BE20]
MSTPLSPAQHGIWLTEQTLDAGAAYHLAVTVGFDGPLDVPALAGACAAVARRHPALGSRIAPDGTAVLAGPAPELRVADCGEDELGKLLADETAARFDLVAGPLARFGLYRTGPGRHVLLVTVHHLAFDGESKDRLVADLAAAYRGDLRESAPPALAAADPAPQDVADATAYWADRWREPGVPVLPGLRQPADGGTAPGPGAAVPFRLTGARYTALAGTADRLGVTRFELLTAAWHALLLRYGNRAPATALELSVRRPGEETAVGLAVNELPLFTEPSAGQPFAAFARAVRGELRTLYRHRTVPLGRAVRGLTPRTALTPLSLSYRRRPAGTAGPGFAAAGTTAGDLAATVRWTGFAGTARNLLHLQFVDSEGELTGSLQYRTEALAPGVAERIAGHLTTLLDGVVADPATPVGDLPLLGPDERAARPAAPAPRPELAEDTVPALFAARAAATPDAVALVADGVAHSYRELAALVAHAAAALTRHGAGPGTLVGIALPRGRDQLVAVLATLAAGAAYLPLDPEYPAERLAFLRADAGLALRVTGEPSGPGDLAPGDLAPAPAGAPGPGEGPALPAGPSPAHPAYVLYTSGSTGTPKGVEVPHGALANLLAALRDRLGSRPEDRWLGLTSLSFDISTVELLLPLTTGGRVVLAPEGAHRDGPALLRLIGRERISHVQATPSGWRVLLDAGLRSAAPGLTALTGGEALPAPLAAELAAATARLVNVYGPTETTVWSTLAEPVETDGRVSIGEPLANTRAHVLDERLHPVPSGLAGELYLGGAGVAHGYRGRPGLTATRFLPDPYGPPGARLYRTGDLVRLHPGGALEYVGRADTQVKLRGHRIELGEIEARLAEHPAVARAAATLYGPDGDRRLAAYVVPAGPPPGPDELRAHLAATLPAAVLPSAYVVLAAFPLTPNGKLDRAALPEPVTVRPEPTAPATGPDEPDDTTAAVLAIWREVLRLDDLGPDEDFFDLGGHSLLMTSIAARIRRQLGVTVPLDVFFDTPTVRGVVAAVADLRKE